MAVSGLIFDGQNIDTTARVGSFYPAKWDHFRALPHFDIGGESGATPDGRCCSCWTVRYTGWRHRQAASEAPWRCCMSLQPCDTYRVPEETARVARAIFPEGNLVMRMYDELGLLFHDRDFADLFPDPGPTG